MQRKDLNAYKQAVGILAVPVIMVTYLSGANYQLRRNARPHRKSVSYCLNVEDAKKIAARVRKHGGKVLGPFKHFKL